MGSVSVTENINEDNLHPTAKNIAELKISLKC